MVETSFVALESTITMKKLGKTKATKYAFSMLHKFDEKQRFRGALCTVPQRHFFTPFSVVESELMLEKQLPLPRQKLWLSFSFRSSRGHIKFFFFDFVLLRFSYSDHG